MVMLIAIVGFELVEIHQWRKLIEVEHRIVLTVLAKESDVLAEVHIL